MSPLTRPLAMAASMDAGDRHMKQHGRTFWNEDDYNAAWAEFDRLWPEEYDVLTAPAIAGAISQSPARGM